MGQRGTSDDGGQRLTVVLILQGAAGWRRVGQPVEVGVEVRNEGAEEVWMVGVIDGSEDGVRYPHYRPSVTRVGLVMAAPSTPEDPLVGPLRVADFRRLGAGEAFDPTQRNSSGAYLPLSTFVTFRPTEPGVYRYALTLSTESEQPEEWLGRFGQEAEHAAVLDLIAHVPRVTVTSNTLEVEVR